MTIKNNNKIALLLYGDVKEDEEGCVTELDGLKQMALRNLPYNEPDIMLRLAIMEMAFIKNDIEYFNTDQFDKRCEDIGLNPNKVNELIGKIWHS